MQVKFCATPLPVKYATFVISPPELPVLLIVNVLYGLPFGSVVIAIPLPATICSVSSPIATRSVCPSTFKVLKVLFIPTFTFPLPRSVTSNPASSSNLIPVTLVTVLVYVPVVVYKLTVSSELVPTGTQLVPFHCRFCPTVGGFVVVSTSVRSSIVAIGLKTAILSVPVTDRFIKSRPSYVLSAISPRRRSVVLGILPATALRFNLTTLLAIWPPKTICYIAGIQLSVYTNVIFMF